MATINTPDLTLDSTKKDSLADGTGPADPAGGATLGSKNSKQEGTVHYLWLPAARFLLDLVAASTPHLAERARRELSRRLEREVTLPPGSDRAFPAAAKKLLDEGWSE